MSCEYLSTRAAELGLDKFILYGNGEEVTDASKEDMMEALIGAVAVDSGWDWEQLETVVDRLICFQISKDLLKPGYYEMFNSWHQRKFGCMPDYETEAVCSGGNGSSGSSQYRQYNCTLRYQIPENDKGIRTAQRVDVQKETRSGARELAAELAYRFVVNNGFWVSLANAEIEPKLEDAINQLQELYQKKYVEAAPQYEFEEQALFDGTNPWYCSCTCGGVEGWGRAAGKTKAKKKAAFMVLVRLMKSAGLGSEELEKAMWETMEG